MSLEFSTYSITGCFMNNFTRINCLSHLSHSLQLKFLFYSNSMHATAVNVLQISILIKNISRIQYMILFLVFHVYFDKKKSVLTLTTHMHGVLWDHFHLHFTYATALCVL